MIDRLAEYNVVWDSPSTGASGSMPVGNGDIGVNVWVETGGDLMLLIAKTDAWDENSINLKLGRVRVKILPNPFVDGEPFRQTLHLKTAEIEIAAGPIQIRIWVDANQPVIRVQASGEAGFEISAQLECWRTEARTVKTQTSDMFKNLVGKNSDPYPTVIGPDQIVENGPGRIVWAHCNQRRQPDPYEVNMRLQGLEACLDSMPHPLLGRTFGAALIVDESRHGLGIYPLTQADGTVEQWQAALNRQIAEIEAADVHEARRLHELWWEKFWNRSWIYIPAAFGVTQAYVLQRFMNAAGGRGGRGGAIKHNGGIFTVGVGDDPDFRRWGGPGWWFQNQRLIYWPMLACGDFDLMRPWFAMYRDSLALQKERTRKYFAHGGAHFPETITFWGAEVSGHYGWTPFEKRARPEAECAYLTYYWSGGIELSLLMCEYFQYTGDKEFARSTLIPVAEAVMEFFDSHYPRTAEGKIRFEPAQALETWHEAVNPLPEIAGLMYTLGKLLELPEDWTTPDQRRRWERMKGELPVIPVGEKDGQAVILPAERFDKKKNTENPELYCIFPYRLFGVGKPDLELAKATFAARLHVSHDCWSQDDIQMALLGLTAQAKEWITQRAAPAAHSDSRFPAFWNAFHDWIPDMDHGGVLQLALQFMLMQAEDGKVEFLPAWPVEWDADFKLHGPGASVYEGAVRAGRVVQLQRGTYNLPASEA